MILIGHPLLESETFATVSSIEEITQTPPRSTLYLPYEESSIDLFRHCRDNSVSMALHVRSIKDALLSNALKAKYIICEKSLAPEIQKVAENYMFDARILCVISLESELEWCALNEIDGVIFKGVIDGIC